MNANFINIYSGADLAALQAALEQVLAEGVSVLPHKSDAPFNLLVEVEGPYIGVLLCWPQDYSPAVTDPLLIAQGIHHITGKWVLFSLDETPYQHDNDQLGAVTSSGEVFLVQDEEWEVSRGELILSEVAPFPSAQFQLA